jgi:membrane fusion protein (multidrug efflux system)
MSHSRSRDWFVALLALCLALTLTACNGGRADADQVEGTEKTEKADRADRERDAEGKDTEEDKEEEEPAVAVEVAALERGAMEAVLRFSTNLEAETQVEVLVEADRRVTRLLVEEGDEVRKGQLLLALQDDQQRTDLAQVESELRKVEREYERQQRLFGQGLIAEEAFNQATYEIEQLQLRKEEAERALSYTQVKAPISGVITNRWVNVGDHVSLGQKVFEIVDFNSIVARVFVPEKELAQLAPNLPARITASALGEARFDGRVDRIAPTVDPASGTVKVTVALPRRAGLRPGLFVDVQLVTETYDDALRVPKRALVQDGEQTFLYRLASNPTGTAAEADQADLVERLEIKAALEDKDYVLPVGELLAPGDQVVVSGQVGLKDGARVRVVGGVEAGPSLADSGQAEDGEAVR